MFPVTSTLPAPCFHAPCPDNYSASPGISVCSSPPPQNGSDKTSTLTNHFCATDCLSPERCKELGNFNGKKSTPKPCLMANVMKLFLAVTKQLHEWFRPSVCPSIYLSVTPFYPRPVLAFGYCHCLCVCMCVRVYVSHQLVCMVTHQLFKLEMQNNLVKVPVVLGGDWPWPSRSNLTWNSKFTPFWACPRHNSPLVQPRTNQFGQKMQTWLGYGPYCFGSQLTLQCQI